MDSAGLIVAAGRGQRLGGETPKQFLDLAGRMILRRSIDAFLAHPAIATLAVVIHPDDRPLYDLAVSGIADACLTPPVLGGATRSASVRAGLEALAPFAPSRVLIHDGARPFVTGGVISAVLEALDAASGAFPALPVVDALWTAQEGLVMRSVPRDGLWRAQTPQGFRFDAILAAHRAHSGDTADDVAVAVAAGLDVRVVRGTERNYKITTRVDLERAKGELNRMLDIRTGNGFDVHRLGPGSHVTLCGIEIPHERGLIGHSDADVGMHALTDAIFGALAEGDIGQWFPPSDPQWEGAASEIFLAKAGERAQARGYAIASLDCTLVCERPRIGPHADAMRSELARITGVAPERISVKATTSETLGFTGREEGIAALATATLVQA
jgi:2-C-methyl-D-erythritol 4-phosphate cytidylyltransferase / 2-C-methyl-D-erythritol 2,4-cyclodiphosphate synthase